MTTKDSKMTYKVISTHMDELPIWIVIDSKDLKEFHSDSYRGEILKGLDLDRKKMEELADKLNKEIAE